MKRHGFAVYARGPPGRDPRRWGPHYITLDTSLAILFEKERTENWVGHRRAPRRAWGPIGRLYAMEKIDTVRDMLAVNKHEFRRWGKFYGQPRTFERAWRYRNYVLQRYGFIKEAAR